MRSIHVEVLLALTVLGGCAPFSGGNGEGNSGAGGSSATSQQGSTTATMTSSSGAEVPSSSSSSSGPGCGNSVVESPESCDGDCPTECIDPDLCTTELPTGDPAQCNVECGFNPLVACNSYDGCCPAGCIPSNDNDCSQKIVVLSGGPVSASQAVKTALTNTAAFGVVDSLNFVSGDTTVPTLAQLTPYSAVLVYNFNSFADPAAYGDLLADYIDQGGRVVLTGASNCADQYRIRGRFESDGYFLNTEGGILPTAGDIDPTFNEPMSPLVVGVTATAVGNYCDVMLQGDTTVVASLTDGHPLVLRGKRNGKNRVDLNFLITTETSNAALLRLVVNALKYPR